MTRSSWSALFLALVMALAALPGTSGALSPEIPDEALIRQLVERQSRAWNEHDATTWSKDFAPDADFVNIVGTVFSGRDEIEKRHAGIFASIFKSSQTRVTVRRLMLLGPDVAVVDMDHEVTGHSALPPGVQNTDASGVLRTRMKYVLRKTAGKWLIVSAQNTDVKPTPPSPKK